MVGNFSCRLEGHTVSFSVKLKSLSFFCMGCSVEIRVQVFFFSLETEESGCVESGDNGSVVFRLSLHWLRRGLGWPGILSYTASFSCLFADYPGI